MIQALETEPAGTDGRDNAGKFSAGNSFGRGNPVARHAQRLRQLFVQAVTEDDVTAIVKKLNTKLPKTKVLLLGIFPRAERADHPMRARIKEINESIAKLDDGKTVFFKNIGGRFLVEDGSLPKATMPDFLHLSAKGYEIWAKSIEPAVAKILGDKPLE